MSKTPFMPLWVSDFLGDTLDLDAQEIGAYMLLIMAQWNRGGESLPNDQKKLKRIARCGRTWPRVWASISHYFETDENGVYSIKCRLVYASVAAKREVNRHNASLGGMAKSLKNNKPPLANANDSLERKAAIPKPKPKYIINGGKISGSLDGEKNAKQTKIEMQFEQFFSAYPKRPANAKAPAFNRFKQALKKIDFDKLMEATRSYARSRVGQDPQFTMKANNWLSGENWEVMVAPANGAKKPLTGIRLQIAKERGEVPQ